MSYLRLIQDKIQDLAESISLALNVDVAIADKNLTRIVGTGYFYSKINENSSEDSLFAKVIETGKPRIILAKKDSKVCKQCSLLSECRERANMIYPIKVDEEIIGVISFASFDINQDKNMYVKKEEYFNMLKNTGEMIGREISNIKTINHFKKGIAEINDIINCLSKGIIIINSQKKIIHVNAKALKILNVNLINEKIVDSHINSIIKKIELKDTQNKEIAGVWNIRGKDVRVMYQMNEIKLDQGKSAIMISFDELNEIINIAKTYENKEKVVFSNIVGKSKSFVNAINKAKIVAQTDSTILIQGESGTGKELFARSIHNESARREGPFVVINCASIPENIIESELFGYEKGAFTGANPKGKKGKIELANNGTLFLDEIGDLPISLQTRLLRVLQERKISRLGGSETIDVNIRVISATHRDLIEMVNKKKFRLDLFYRLNVIPIYLPSLKEREDDVLLCSEYIIKKICKRMNKEKKTLSPQVKEAFLEYNWPGNIRELENVLEYSICFSNYDEIRICDLPDYFSNSMISKPKREEENKNNNKLVYNFEDLLEIEGRTLEELTDEFEKTIIKSYIEKYGDTTEGKKIVANKLNIGLTTLYRKLNDYNNFSETEKFQ